MQTAELITNDLVVIWRPTKVEPAGELAYIKCLKVETKINYELESGYVHGENRG